MNISIIHAGLYVKPEKMVQKLPCDFLGLNLSGLEYSTLYSPAGVPATQIQDGSLTLIPESFTADFSYRENRKNYVIMCKIDGLFWNEHSGTVELECNGVKFGLPLSIPIPPGRREYLQEQFRRIVSFYDSAFTSNRNAAELLSCSVLAEFLEYAARNIEKNIPEEILRLKEIIDSDTSFRRSLKEIMKPFPVTDVHLRRLFQRYYKMTPAEYRARLRFSRVQELLRDGSLNFKEIADEVGMNHVTHLHIFLKKHCGMTPGELQKSFRFKI